MTAGYRDESRKQTINRANFLHIIKTVQAYIMRD